MSLTEIHNVVLLLSNPVWGGAPTVPGTLTRNVTDKTSQLAYEQTISKNLTTLTTTNAETLDGYIRGLLYVPDITAMPSCDKQQYDFIPSNVTRRSDLPPTLINYIAIAPWFSVDCTLAYLAAASLDPIRGFIFYKPNNSTNKPQDVDSPVWNLNDGGAWKTGNRFPIFAVSGIQGQRMMTELSLYSGNITEIPHGEEINEIYGPSPNDYVRIWSELRMHNSSGMPALWSFSLIVLGALVIIITSVSLTMHLMQRRRRRSLEKRVQTGEVDLEAMGIKRLTVPAAHVRGFPVFTYNAEPDTASVPPTPTAPSIVAPRSTRSRRSRRSDQASEFFAPASVRSSRSERSIRSKRSSLTGMADTTATNDQPRCEICLACFEHRFTIIRELPCGHIFHTECIDEFLIFNSSLCPKCKHCMLPKGYSPKITNGMVRRERALRKLREKVYLDEGTDTSRSHFKSWSSKLLSFSNKKPPASLPLTSVKSHKNSRDKSSSSLSDPSHRSPSDSPPSNPSPPDNAADSPPPEAGEGETIPPPAAATRRTRRRPRALKTLPTQPENSELKTTGGRASPSSFARVRMRELAAKNAPFEDPDRQRPQWRRAVSKVFPGFS